MTEPELFVVCKNCGSEVSPYVTECPYCGQRVRRRAPKIERGGATGGDSEPRAARRPRPPSLGRLRRGEIPGIAPDTRPYATWALIVAALLASLVTRTPRVSEIDVGAVTGPLQGSEWWRVAATPFIHGTNVGYLFVTMVATALFGSLLERRFGRWAPVLVFVLAGAAGAALASVAGLTPALGANGAALGLLFAWFVDDRRLAARGLERDTDLLGVYVFAVVLALLAVAEPQASAAAAAGGAVMGALLGFVLSAFRRA